MAVTESSALAIFHPLIRRWFETEIGAPTDIQQSAWAAIARGEHCLITAPTGSGKTLSAFLWALDRLITGAWPANGLRVVYVSPLKALNNDIQRNLLRPLEGLQRVFHEAGTPFPEIRVLTRSGDTPQRERQSMVRRPPEILVTTPESLNLLLSSPKARGMLAGVRTVILDEIHAVAGTKRGTHLITAVDRLVPLTGEFQRIALSATVRPMEAVAEFVGGYTYSDRGGEPEYRPRAVSILRSSSSKTYDTRVCFPHDTLYEPDGGPRWEALAAALKEVIARNRSTLLFAVSRRMCERLTLYLNENEDRLIAYAHHGSLSLEIRRLVEQKLKDGALSAIVATNSLELGIDVGTLDEVVLVQAPLTVAGAVQRAGRAGHQVGAVSRVALYPIHAHDLIELSTIARALREQDIEEIRIVPAPLDVLAQVLVSMTGVEPWNADALYQFIRSSAPYRQLPRASFDRVVHMLAGRYAGTRIRALQPVVSFDAVDNTLRGQRAGLQVLYRSGGTIPDRGQFNLRRQDTKAKIGELDEEFVWERSLGDTFIFGTQAWSVRQITHNDVLVLPGNPNRSMPPFWRGEGIPRSDHLSTRITEFMEEAERRLDDPAWRDELVCEVPMNERGADALITYLRQQRAATQTPLPHRHHLLVERAMDYRKGAEHPQLVIHTMWGVPVNRPLTVALAQAIADQLGHQPEVFCDNNAIVMPLYEALGAFDPFAAVTPENIEPLLRTRLEQTGFFGARFRENAARALLLPRDAHGQRMPLWMTRVRSKRLLDAIAECPDFPILAETWRTCLQDEFSLGRLKELLQEIRTGAIRVTYAETAVPSPFSKSIMWQQVNSFMYRDDQPESPVRSRLSDDVLAEVVHSADLRPQIDPALASGFEQKLQRIYPGYAPSSAAELIEWVKERQYLPWSEWEGLLAAIERDTAAPTKAVVDAAAPKLARVLDPEDAAHGICALENVERLRAAFGTGIRVQGLDSDADIAGASAIASESEITFAEWLTDWFRFYGPTSETTLLSALPVPGEAVAATLAELVDAKALVAGKLLRNSTAMEFCDTENFESLLRIARASARPAHAPLPATALPLFLAAWQGIATSDGRSSDPQRGVESLFGFPAAVELLESDYLAARIPNYKPALLDEWIASGGLIWVGVDGRKVLLAPREAVDFFQRNSESVTDALLPSPIGRYSFGELLDYTGLASAELMKRVWACVWHGEITSDSFAPVRVGIRTRFRAPAAEMPVQRGRRNAFRAWKATRSFEGNWFAVPQGAEPEDALGTAELDSDRARLLLDRYGVVFREILQHELPPLQWSAVFRALRRLELAGECVAGSFFEGILGVQFVSPAALPRLHGDLPEDAVYWCNATDPISPCGLGLRSAGTPLPARLKTTRLIFCGRRLAIAVRRSGKELDIHLPPNDPALAGGMAKLRAVLHQADARGVGVTSINNVPSLQSEFLDILRTHFHVIGDTRRITLYPKIAS